jgi:multisubunit Na+/H+ antiporter MnhB subunit
MASAGVIMATAFGLLYLAYAPVPRSLATDGSLAIAIYLLGGLMGASIENRLENSISLRRPEASILRQPRDANALERSAA